MGPTSSATSNPATIYDPGIFGPVLCLCWWPPTTLNEAIRRFINANPNGNGTAIFTQSGAAAAHLQEEIDVGQVGINVPNSCAGAAVLVLRFACLKAGRPGPLQTSGAVLHPDQDGDGTLV